MEFKNSGYATASNLIVLFFDRVSGENEQRRPHRQLTASGGGGRAEQGDQGSDPAPAGRVVRGASRRQRHQQQRAPRFAAPRAKVRGRRVQQRLLARFLRLSGKGGRLLRTPAPILNSDHQEVRDKNHI